jgi:hypothetical protein
LSLKIFKEKRDRTQKDQDQEKIDRTQKDQDQEKIEGEGFTNRGGDLQPVGVDRSGKSGVTAGNVNKKTEIAAKNNTKISSFFGKK